MKVSKEVKIKFCGVRGKNKISKCFGVYNYFLFYNKIRPKEDKYKLTWKEHSDIIHAIHRELKEEVFNSGYIEFPYRIGSLTLFKSKDQKVKFVDGKIKIPNGYLIDWDSTHELWENDEEAYANRTLVRFEVKNLYSVGFKAEYGSYKNQLFYKFQLVREFKKEIARRAKNNTLDNFFIRNG